MERSDGRICRACLRSLKRVEREDPVCRETSARLREHGIDGPVSLFYFEKDGALQSILHQLKYRGMSSLGKEMGAHLGELLLNVPSIDLIVPVPLHRAKLRERGYNQSDYLCRGIASRIEVPVRKDILERVRFTATQTKLTIENREANVAGAFRVRPKSKGEVDERSVVVVDDVITTGSTIISCAQALRGAGASHVIACSLGLAEKNVL